MNISELNNEFDLGFNNSFSGFSPGIDMYEKSLFFTQAEEAVVLELAPLYDSDEKVREALRNITVNSSISYNSTLNANLISLKFNTNSKFFEVPTDVWYILSEHIDSDVNVKPITTDEYNTQVKNPFKKPLLNSKAWRLDVSDTISTTPLNIREIVYPSTIATYTFRYLKKPDPIILETLTGDYSIDGETAEATCKLSSSLHRKIVDKAVQIATLAYKENTLQNNVQLK